MVCFINKEFLVFQEPKRGGGFHRRDAVVRGDAVQRPQGGPLRLQPVLQETTQGGTAYKIQHTTYNSMIQHTLQGYNIVIQHFKSKLGETPKWSI